MRKNIKVNGMHCVSCEKLIENELKNTEGIQTVNADFPNETVEVEFDKNKISLDKITDKISKLGYSALGKKAKKENKGFFKNLLYALVPHTGCFAFILITVFGITGAAVFLRPLMMNAYFFYALILFSFVMTTVSVVLYLKKNRILSINGLKRKWKYTSTMYGITIGVNLLLFLVIFPYTANIGSGVSGLALANLVESGDYSLITLSVNIPCPGHAPLISGDLKTIDGVQEVRYSLPSNFDVYYDSQITNKQEILSLEVFDTYPATVLEEQNGITGAAVTDTTTKRAPSGGGCGCGGGTCGSSSGSCCGA